MNRNNHIGKILLSEELLLRFLDFFPEGHIRNIIMGNFGQIEIIIEHPDMPELTNEGESIQVVTPEYISYTDALGHSITMRKRK